MTLYFFMVSCKQLISAIQVIILYGVLFGNLNRNKQVYLNQVMIPQSSISTSALLVTVSSLLYGSADFYVHYQDPDNIFCKLLHLSLGMKTFMCWTFLIVTLVVIFFLVKLRYALTVIQLIQLIFLPWAFHSLSPLFMHQDSIASEKRILININVIPLSLFIISTAIYLLRLTLIYSTPEDNLLMKVQGKTRIFQLLRLVISGLVPIIGANSEVTLYIFMVLSLVVTFHKILNITYYSLGNQFCYLLMEAWTWTSIAIAFLREHDIERIYLFYLFLIPIGILIKYPPKTVVDIFEMKIKWNMKIYQKVEQQYYNALNIFYGSRVLNKKVFEIEDPVLSQLSNQFQQQIIDCLKSKEIVKSNHKTRSKCGFQKSNSDRFNLIIDFIESEKIITSNSNRDMDGVNFCICNVLIELQILSFRAVYQLYYRSISSSQTVPFLKEVCLMVCYKQFERVMESFPDINNYPIKQLRQYDEIQNLLDNYINNDESVLLNRQHIIKKDEMVEFLVTKQKLREEIHEQMSELEEVLQTEDNHLVYLRYLVTKNIDNNPYIAEKYIKKQIIKRNQSSINLTNITKRETDVVFVSSLPSSGMEIKHLNTNCLKILEFNSKEEMPVKFLIPSVFRQAHEELTNSKNIFSMYMHNENPYYLVAQKSTNIYESDMVVKFYVGLQNQLLVIAACNINTTSMVKLVLEKEYLKEQEQQILESNMAIEESKSKEILGVKVHIIKTTTCTNYKTKNLLNLSESKAKLESNINPILRDLNLKEGAELAQLQEKKHAITPLNPRIPKLKNYFIVLVLLMWGFVYTAQSQNIHEIKSYNTLNTYSNEIYKNLLLTQLYFPILYMRYLVAKHDQDSQTISMLQKEAAELEENVDTFFNRIREISHQPGFMDLTFQEIPFEKHIEKNFKSSSQDDEKEDHDEEVDHDEEEDHDEDNSEGNYLYQIMKRIITDFKSHSQIMQQSRLSSYSSKIFTDALERKHKIKENNFISILTDSFKIKFSNLSVKSETVEYTGLFSIILTFTLYLWAFMKVRSTLQKFADIVIKNSDFFIANICKINRKLKQGLSSLKNKNYCIENNDSGLKASKVRSRLHHTDNLNNEYAYPYKKQLLFIVISFILVIGVFIYEFGPFKHKKTIEDFNSKFEGKVQFFQISISMIHSFEQLVIDYGNSQNLTSIFPHEQESQQPEEFVDTNIVQILRKFAIDQPDIRVHAQQNPCKSWLNCSDFFISNTTFKNLFIYKDIMDINNKLFINTDNYQEKLKIMDESIKEIREIIYLAFKIFDRDSEISTSLTEETEKNDYLVTALVVVIGLCWILSLIKLSLTNDKYIKQVYRILPLSMLIKNPDFSPAINRTLRNIDSR